MYVKTTLRDVLAASLLVAMAMGCGKARSVGSGTAGGTQITLTGASVNGSRQVVASYTLTQGGAAVGADAASSLRPSFTLAALSVDPQTVGLPPDPATGSVRDPVPAWQSQVLTGSETLASLPIGGPGSTVVLTNVKQPGSESNGTVQDLGNGKFTYTFQTQLPAGYDASQTLRVGVWLAGTPGTAGTTSTFDFVPNGGPVQAHELVLDANCNVCHGTLRSHGGFRTGVKICLTCHTFQNADADTSDPAALSNATPVTDPNPLDMGRMIHRIHRGKNLPTLYTANRTRPNATRANISLPFFPGRNAPRLGQKFSIVGFQSTETVFGQIVSRTDNNQPAAVVATGVGFPQDLRNCDACHGNAAQANDRYAAISRRTCQGCHPDTWFEDPALITDSVHFMHPGDVQPDDSACIGCHIPTATAPDVDADITALHVAPANSPNWNGLTAQIVSVQNMQPAKSPTVVFTLTDRDGTPSPLDSPTPAADSTSPVPRALGRVAITISGPTSPDYATGNFASAASAPITESVPLTTAANGSGQFSYTFKAALPAAAAGTWAVGIEATRSATAAFYDAASDTFPWPFTGERLTEWTDNPVQYVDVGVGTAPGGSPSPRRQVVSQAKCESCHMKLSLHGGNRHQVEYCVLCHAPDATDWSRRPKDATGNVDLAGTFDDIEERSIHLKVLVHRIHTGGRAGSAELDAARPFVVYGFGGSVNFFDDVRFPNDLANCTLCHAGGTYQIDAVPAGARPTEANEKPSILHAGTAAHGSGEPTSPPVQAACLGCHDTGAAQLHAQQNTVSGVEQCVQCHGRATGVLAVDKIHGLQP